MNKVSVKLKCKRDAFCAHITITSLQATTDNPEMNNNIHVMQLNEGCHWTKKIEITNTFYHIACVVN